MAKYPILSVILAGSTFLLTAFLLIVTTSSNSFAISNNTITLTTLKRYVDGITVSYIVTDTSDNKTAESITKSQGHKINFAPLLSTIPNQYVQQGYDFLNGIEGEGPFGYQLPVGTALPGDSDYSPMIHLNFINWTDTTKAKTLKSTEEITQAEQNGDIQITPSGIIINNPAIGFK
ncbi:DUF7482 domain-containing protein [Candidatus Nitrosocosmicus sp. T]